MLNITEIKIFLVNEEQLKAYITMVISGSFIIRDIKIINGKEGLFISMPSKKMKNGSFKDIAHPLNKEVRSFVEEAIFKRYKEEVHKHSLSANS